MISALCFLFLWQIYVPAFFSSGEKIIYSAQRGAGIADITNDLKEKKLIKSSLFFKLYVILFVKHASLQAGTYELSPAMPIAKIVKKLAAGDIVNEKVTIVEGWTIKDIAKHLESKKVYPEKDFLNLTTENKDWSEFSFLHDKPKDLSLEGYLFPDTYFIASGEKPEKLIINILENFDKKLTSQLRQEIANQKKSIFKIVTMASLLEKEVISLEDKKIVAGILWKRLENNMSLQVDATINFITNKNKARTSLDDITIDSPYNTYKYLGLPKGPIGNPGMESILAAIYPQESDYWYYLSSNGNKETIFSRTLDDHNLAKIKYLPR